MQIDLFYYFSVECLNQIQLKQIKCAHDNSMVKRSTINWMSTESPIKTYSNSIEFINNQSNVTTQQFIQQYNFAFESNNIFFTLKLIN